MITEEVVGEIKVLWGRGRGSGCRPLLKLIAEERKKERRRVNEETIEFLVRQVIRIRMREIEQMLSYF